MVWILSLVGLAILLLSGDFLVRGAVNLSLRLGVPALIVSLTIVAFGTSAPELLIAISAVDEGASGIAVGNVIGSNIANVLLVLGMPALLSTLDFSECDTRRDFYIMLGSTVVFIALAATGQFGWWQGAILLIMLAGFLGSAVWRAKCQTEVSSSEGDDLEGLDPDLPMWKALGFLLLGLIGLPMGADILVDNAVYIASAYGTGKVGARATRQCFRCRRRLARRFSHLWPAPHGGFKRRKQKDVMDTRRLCTRLRNLGGPYRILIQMHQHLQPRR